MSFFLPAVLVVLYIAVGLTARRYSPRARLFLMMTTLLVPAAFYYLFWGTVTS